jgi:hypothetical protein
LKRDEVNRNIFNAFYQLSVTDEKILTLFDEIAEDVYAQRKNEIKDEKALIANKINTLEKRKEEIID